MKQIKKERFFGTEDGLNLIEAEIDVDELEELPAVDEFAGKRLIIGSECRVAGTGDIYIMTSKGDWVKRNFNGGGGGGGGTDDYNSLTNQPKINNVTLRGNKTLEDLGINPLTSVQMNSLINLLD